MSGVMLFFTCFGPDGHQVSGGSLFLPDYLDWMQIEVKAQWFRQLGDGPKATTHVLLRSQGEQLLLSDITLNPLDKDVHQERYHGNRHKIEEFIEQGGFSRVRRNQ